MTTKVDPYDHEAMRDAIDMMIESSPVVATCECGNEIREAEIGLGTASGRECSSCVLAYVADMVGDYY